jgi:hypothetical protein
VVEQTVTLKGGATLTLREVEEQLAASAPKIERRPGSLAPVKPEHDAEVVEMVRRSR